MPRPPGGRPLAGLCSPLVVAAYLLQTAPDALRPGVPVQSEIAEGDAVVHTATLDRSYTDAPALGRRFPLEVAEAGTYTLELRSLLFDGYLVLRGAGDEVLAESDDGPLGLDPRVTVERLEPGVAYRVDACALHGDRGPFELLLVAGRPAESSPAERAAANRSDAAQRVDALEQARDEDDPGLARALRRHAQLAAASGDLATARSLMERFVSLLERTTGAEALETAAALQDLALIQKAQGDLDAARSTFERLVAIREATLGPDEVDTATAISGLATVLQAQGDLAAARPLFHRVFEIDERVLGLEHRFTATALNNEAAVLQAQGDFAAALPLAEQALAIREKVLGPDDPETATAVQNLGQLHRARGDLSAARRCLERALAIREKTLGPTHPDTARALRLLAWLLQSQGDLAAARPLSERALAIVESGAGARHPDTALALNDYAALLEAQGDLDAARPLLERALSIDEEVLGPEHRETATALCNLATLLRTQRDYDSARALCERALAIREAALGATHPETAQALASLATILRLQGRLAEARPLLERALDTLETVQGPDHPDTAAALTNLALLAADQGDTGRAWDLAHRTDASLGRARRQLAALSEAEGYRYVATLVGQLHAQLSLAALLATPEAQREAFDALLAWKGQSGRLLGAARERILASMSAEQQSLVEDLRSCQGRLSQLAFAQQIPDPAAHQARLAELQKERNRLEVELNRTAEPSGSAPPTFASVRTLLPERSALVVLYVHPDYRPARRDGDEVVEAGAWSEPQVSAWVVRRADKTPVRVELGPAQAMFEAVHAALSATVGAGAGRGDQLDGAPARVDASAKLRELVWAPLAPLLAETRTVFVSPDGVLATMPFEVLPDAGGRFLIEDRAFVYLADTSTLADAPPAAGPGASLLAVGGIDYDTRAAPGATPADDALAWADSAAARGASRPRSNMAGPMAKAWSALAFTAEESGAVVALHDEAFPGRPVLLLEGSDPTEERLKAELPRHDVVHLATHGFFAPEGLPSMWDAALDGTGAGDTRPRATAGWLAGYAPGLLSGIVCAGANAPPAPGQDDGYLTAEEVGWLDLSHVDLVVLSACETGLGRPQSGEGLLGLRRALLGAGARTVISSLWKVPDESTSRLMEDFYRNLWLKHLPPGEALRAAQLALLERNRGESGTALPATWGAFVLEGEWR